MIEPEYYKFPHKQEQQQQQTDDQQQRAEETLAHLESLPWRPIGVEW